MLWRCTVRRLRELAFSKAVVEKQISQGERNVLWLAGRKRTIFPELTYLRTAQFLSRQSEPFDMSTFRRSLSTPSQLSSLGQTNGDKIKHQDTLKRKLTDLDRQISDALFRLNNSKDASPIRQLREIKASALASVPHVERLGQLAVELSLDPSNPTNGYATLIDLYCRAIDCTNQAMALSLGRRYNLRRRSSLSLLKAWATLIAYLSKATEICVDMIGKYSEGQLSVDASRLTQDELDKIQKLTYGQDLFGRTLGFQYEEAYASYVRAIAVAFASYGEGSSYWNRPMAKTAASLFFSPKYVVNPELRSKQLVQTVRNASISFFKNMLSFTETDLFYLRIRLSQSNVLINVPFTIEYETAEEKGETAVRLLSDQLFDGMLKIPEIRDKYQKGTRQMTPTQQTNVLLLHVHGGGFISMSSKSHEVYLRPWARRFKVPILSVDYALAPERPFPAALNDCIRAYNWALENKSKLGWTGERIVLVGDSAGGNLIAAVTLNQITKGRRKPDQLCLVYPALMMKSMVSPSRLLSNLDVILNPELSLRFVAAYVGIQDRSSEEIKRIKNAQESGGQLALSNTDYLLDRLRQSHELLSNPLMSPMNASDELWKQFPKTSLWCGTYDPVLDDNVEAIMRLKRLGINCSCKWFKQAPHGFLNILSGNVCNEARLAVTNDIAKIIDELKGDDGSASAKLSAGVQVTNSY